MALQKEITINGVTASYHRIYSVANNSGLLNVQVRSYIDESYRNHEANVERIIELKNKDELTDEERAELVELERRQNEDAFVTENYIPMEYDDSISFDEIYSNLKNIDLFKGAEDI